MGPESSRFNCTQSDTLGSCWRRVEPVCWSSSSIRARRVSLLEYCILDGRSAYQSSDQTSTGRSCDTGKIGCASGIAKTEMLRKWLTTPDQTPPRTRIRSSSCCLPTIQIRSRSSVQHGVPKRLAMSAYGRQRRLPAVLLYILFAASFFPEVATKPELMMTFAEPSLS